MIHDENDHVIIISFKKNKSIMMIGWTKKERNSVKSNLEDLHIEHQGKKKFTIFQSYISQFHRD